MIPPVAPTVTAGTPVAKAAGVALNNALISAAFSEPTAAITGSASFTVSCAAPCTSPSGTVSFDATRRVATFAMAGGASLSPSTTYTATITGARSLATGLALATPYVWQFRTGLLADTTRPRVVLTVPATTPSLARPPARRPMRRSPRCSPKTWPRPAFPLERSA
ncbi:MAG: Ig-like domain-containing protein [Comamonadaceae bacterium]|uniref:Ig-like domain-containing protein n=1 Tax=Candidatus Skiveiella danica TaxID=3386177 RepID=UPI00390B1AFC|nr:Ig-like domain-containing protein [Comamonadaceae bacterium]